MQPKIWLTQLTIHISGLILGGLMIVGGLLMANAPFPQGMALPQTAKVREVQGQTTILLHTEAFVITANSGQTKVTATLRDPQGQSLSGLPVQFGGQLVQPVAASVVSDGNGVATTTFSAGSTAGQAVITAQVGDSTALAYVEVRATDPSDSNMSLSIETGTTSLQSGQSTSITVLVRNAAGQPLANIAVTLFGSLGAVSPASLVTNEAGHATASFVAGKLGGRASLTALAGNFSASNSLQIILSPNVPPDGATKAVYLPLIAR